jgi:hypothetical protein
MGVNSLNRKERFATEGLRFQRHNPDGSIPTPQRFLGFANTVNLSKIVNSSGKADLTIKIDDGATETKYVDFSDAENLTEVTVAEAVSALNSADFTGIIFSADTNTTRLKGSVTGTDGAGKKIIQVVGKLAAGLDFGQSLRHGGNGLEIISFFDDETISIGLPKDIKDKEEIDIEGAKGTITRMIIGAMLQGMSPVVTLKVKDYNLLELVQGGIFDREKFTYDPPLSHESDHPTFWAEVFSPIYSEGSNKLSDMSGYERIFLRTMIGTEGDIPIEAKAWAQYAFNLSATEYTDENGERFPAWQEQVITIEQFDALRLKNFVIKTAA